MIEQILGTNYRLKKRIGGGSFGEIYQGETIHTKRPIAIKLEKLSAPIPQLEAESKLYAIFSGGPGIPQVRWFGSNQTHRALVMELLGQSLEEKLDSCHRPMSLKNVLMLADQMLCSIEFIHNKNFIHRDIKSDNFVMGTGDNESILYIIDYGLAKKYRDTSTLFHIPYSEGRSLTGTARYASVGALRGCEQSRRDDLESLAYVLIYLMKGSLPWMGLDIPSRNDKYNKILELKSSYTVDELCKGLPSEFVQFLFMVKRLGFTERPNYSRYRRLFRSLFIKSGFVYDSVYDWTKKLHKKTFHQTNLSSTSKLTSHAPKHLNSKDKLKKRKNGIRNIEIENCQEPSPLSPLNTFQNPEFSSIQKKVQQNAIKNSRHRFLIDKKISSNAATGKCSLMTLPSNIEITENPEIIIETPTQSKTRCKIQKKKNHENKQIINTKKETEGGDAQENESSFSAKTLSSSISASSTKKSISSSEKGANENQLFSANSYSSSSTDSFFDSCPSTRRLSIKGGNIKSQSKFKDTIFLEKNLSVPYFF
ncbi:Casein kinase I isoform delta-like protein [Tritrichomonas foetus]|uniref:non-specific serine/threonine protein kinase n=1 Tax=Tritrichomonas foetus TaxID=1144522 RepID=A0A1J4KQQ1_9EUKA|nr:Casein kinase I isoform delta-like protein [Tritrichomonas foetus]|eukprot:OHT11789.1 Casein kinase I isoform delta-like protein [Tritrichomonas foetus]